MVQENCPVPAGPDTGRYGDALPDHTYADDAGSNTYAGDSCGHTYTVAA